MIEQGQMTGWGNRQWAEETTTDLQGQARNPCSMICQCLWTPFCPVAQEKLTNKFSLEFPPSPKTVAVCTSSTQKL